MFEIVATIGLSTVLLYAAIVGAAWFLHGRRAGPRERALFVSWAVYGGLFGMATGAWQAAGICAFLSASEFWRGAWVGGSAVFWLGYGPALFVVVRLSRRQTAMARASDAAVVA
jgi:hypothetical protein